jgi:DNA-binding NarL/FixJ family response regulator
LKLLVVEDHALVREGLAQTLRRLEDGVDVMEARDAESALKMIEQAPEVDLLLLDLMLPGINGFSFLGVLRKRFPAVPVVVVSALEDDDSVQRALRHGASGFVPKTRSGDELITAVRTVLDGGIYSPTRDATRSGRPGALPRQGLAGVTENFGLTAAQSRVLELMAQGKSNREIGELLGLAEGTVKIHVSAIFKALNVNSRAQALVVIARQGLKL